MSALWGTPAAIYAIDHRGAELCRDMAIGGFGFDAERARELAAVLEGEEAAARMRLNEAVGRRVSALSVKDLGRAFFKELGAPVFFRSELTGAPSLGVDAMRGYAACADPQLRAAALATLDVRRARKIRSTYILRPLSQLGLDGRIHPSWMNYGAVSGRWSCQDPNLMNLPRAATDPTRHLGGVRGLYIARPGYTLVAFDAKQLEMRIAAYASGDPAMIAACESKDLHGGNAKVIFQAAFDLALYEQLKEAHAETDARFIHLDGLRTLAKSAGFAVCYMAQEETVYARIVADGKGDLLPNGVRSVAAMLGKLRRGFAVYFAWQDSRLLEAIRTGYTDEPITGRRRWLGHDPAPTECANHPIQGGAAGLMNLRLPAIVDALRKHDRTTQLVAQVHDAGVFECREEAAEAVGAICAEVFEQEILLRSSGLRAKFPIDIKVGRRWK